jgi:hypothetical protein
MINLDEAYLAYQQVISGDTTLTEDLEEDNDVYSGIEYLNHYDLGILAEDIVDHLLYEDYDLNDIQEQFLESLNESIDYNKSVLNEASVYNTPTVRDDSKVKLNVPSRREIDKGYKADAKKAYKLKTDVINARIKAKRAAKRTENNQKLKKTVNDTISKIKTGAKRGVNAVKSGLSKANSDVRSKVKDAKVAAHGPLKNYAAKRGLHKDITSKAGNPLKSSSQIQTRGQSHRDQLRKAVVKDVGSRIRNKASQVAVGAYNKGREAVNSVKDTAGRAKQGVKNAVSRTKRNVSSAVSNVKGAVKSGIGKAARRVADRLGEDVDLFDYISDFLISEGYADTLEDAEYLMANELTEGQIEAILDEGFVKFPTDKVVAKADKLINTKPGSKKKAKDTKRRLKSLGNAYALNASYDIVADFLMSEGYADTLEDAEYLIVNELTDDQIEAILDEAKVDDGKSEAEKKDVRGRRHIENNYGPDAVANYNKGIVPNRGTWAAAERRRVHRSNRGVKKA